MNHRAMSKFQFSLGNLLLAVSCFGVCVVCGMFVLRTRETLDYIYIAVLIGASSGAAVGALLKGLRGAFLGAFMGAAILSLICLLAGIPYFIYLFIRYA